MIRILPLALLAVALAACGSNASETGKAVTEPAAAPVTSAAPVTAAAATPAISDVITGSVLERLDAPPYAYLRIQTATGEIWAAVPATDLATGAAVTVYQPMLMSNFESKTLQRTFDAVYFGMLEAPGAASAADGNPHAAMSKPAQVDVGQVEKASGADARTVAETWEQGAGLAGKTVTVRGKVVKYNPGVMAKNWIHLQDGSGDVAKGTNDLTVTSLDEVVVGDTVTITGTVAVDKDFGAGYRYPIIVEEAKLVKQ
ncbi:MAG TPA: OB-fold nucleic acid binding domain-containing protein [Xanthomonadales bacterium]|nr:OB-fold nucleic acid binding domain-containing protein [Xanthomonadales bacterium]